MITDILQLDPRKSYTYADYLKWRLRERVELIRGKIFKMAPAPSSIHQETVTVLLSSLHQFLKTKSCKVYAAPFDVRLPAHTDDEAAHTVVQPDICVICDLSKIDERGCNGAPDLVVEIISPGSVAKDLHEKYELYQDSGVKEYWVAQPLDKLLTIYRLKAGRYVPGKQLTIGDKALSEALSGFELDLNDLFPGILREPEYTYTAKEIRLDP